MESPDLQDPSAHQENKGCKDPKELMDQLETQDLKGRRGPKVMLAHQAYRDSKERWVQQDNEDLKDKREKRAPLDHMGHQDPEDLQGRRDRKVFLVLKDFLVRQEKLDFQVQR